jgi:uncharacterized membrane protein
MSSSSPRSIDDYLQALRAALAGTDPALIQDALYDAQDHLRAEAAANPAKSEAQLIEQIVPTYGTPDEVAAAYRHTEATVTAALHPPASRHVQPASPLKRFFSVYSDSRAYVSLAFMFLSLGTGILYFTFAVTGLALSVGLAILIIGLPVFLGFIGIARVISLGEGRLLEAVTGERMPRRPMHSSAPDGLLARVLGVLNDRRTWTTIVYFLVMLPLGILYFVVAVTGVALGVSFVLAPGVAIAQRLDWLPWDEHLVIRPFWMDTPAGWVSFVVLGVVILTALLHLARGLIRVHASVAKALLVAPGG